MTSPLLFANNASTTLGSRLLSTATTCTVATGAGAQFPDPAPGQYFHATLWAAGSTTGIPNEIVSVTSRSGDTMTIVRAQEGTSAQAWAIGDTFALYLTASDFATFAQQVDVQTQAGNFADDTGSANNGVITLTPAPVNQAALIGVEIRVLKVAATNTGAYTLNVNGLGGVAVKLPGDIALTGNELEASGIYVVIYDGSDFELVSPPAVLEPGSVTNAELAVMAATTFKANPTGSSAEPQDIAVSSLLTMLGATGKLWTIYSTAGHFTIPIEIAGVQETLIVNVGPYSIATPVGSHVDVTFDLPFPTSILLPMIQVQNAAAQMIGTSLETKTGMRIEKGTADAGDGTARSGMYLAIGY